jgi:hypothetical protein
MDSEKKYILEARLDDAAGSLAGGTKTTSFFDWDDKRGRELVRLVLRPVTDLRAEGSGRAAGVGV